MIMPVPVFMSMVVVVAVMVVFGKHHMVLMGVAIVGNGQDSREFVRLRYLRGRAQAKTSWRECEDLLCAIRPHSAEGHRGAQRRIFAPM
jgi:hypothetical protein